MVEKALDDGTVIAVDHEAPLVVPDCLLCVAGVLVGDPQVAEVGTLHAPLAEGAGGRRP